MGLATTGMNRPIFSLAFFSAQLTVLSTAQRNCVRTGYPLTTPTFGKPRSKSSCGCSQSG